MQTYLLLLLLSLSRIIAVLSACVSSGSRIRLHIHRCRRGGRSPCHASCGSTMTTTCASGAADDAGLMSGSRHYFRCPHCATCIHTHSASIRIDERERERRARAERASLVARPAWASRSSIAPISQRASSTATLRGVARFDVNRRSQRSIGIYECRRQFKTSRPSTSSEQGAEI